MFLRFSIHFFPCSTAEQSTRTDKRVTKGSRYPPVWRAGTVSFKTPLELTKCISDTRNPNKKPMSLRVNLRGTRKLAPACRQAGREAYVFLRFLIHFFPCCALEQSTRTDKRTQEQNKPKNEKNAMSLRVGFATFSGVKVVSRSIWVTKGSRYPPFWRTGTVSFKTPLELTHTKTKPHVIPVGHRFYFFANFTETR